MKRHHATVRAAAALTAATLSGHALAAQQFSFEPSTTPPEVITPSGMGAGLSYQWRDSYGYAGGPVTRAYSNVGATDGAFSMHINDADGGYGGAHTEVLWNTDTHDAGRYNDLTTSTKMLFDVTVGPGTFSYAGLHVDLNYGGGYLGSYGGNFTQVVGGPAQTQTFTWDFGGRMVAAGAATPWQGLNGYVLLHINTNSGGGTGVPSTDYFIDNFRVVNEDPATQATWQAAAAGDWTDNANWSTGTAPNAVGAPAVLYGAGNGSVNVNAPVTLGSLIFDAQVTKYDVYASATPPPIVNYTLGGTGSLTFDVASGAGFVEVIAGNHVVDVPVTVSDNLLVNTSAGFGPDSGAPGGGRVSSVGVTSLNFAKPITVDAGATLSKSGVGVVTFNGAVSGAGGLNIRGGGAVLGANVNVGALSVSPSATATVAANGNRVVRAQSMAIGGKLDLTNNKLIAAGAGSIGTFNTTTGAYDGVTGMVQAGRNGGAWDGNGIMTSQTHADIGLTSLAVALASETPYAGGTFGGQSVAGNDVLVMYTYGGDADLNGAIDSDDYFAIDSNFNLSGSVFGWTKGDFDYNGAIDSDDYFIIDSNFNNQILGTFAASSGAAEGITAVPEPASGCVIALAGAALAGRRRRRS